MGDNRLKHVERSDGNEKLYLQPSKTKLSLPEVNTASSTNIALANVYLSLMRFGLLL